jgi:hypothetical protein
LQLSKLVKEENKIIFTTAYPQFAIQSYEVWCWLFIETIWIWTFYEAVLKVKNSFKLR